VCSNERWVKNELKQRKLDIYVHSQFCPYGTIQPIFSQISTKQEALKFTSQSEHITSFLSLSLPFIFLSSSPLPFYFSSIKAKFLIFPFLFSSLHLPFLFPSSSPLFFFYFIFMIGSLHLAFCSNRIAHCTLCVFTAREHFEQVICAHCAIRNIDLDFVIKTGLFVDGVLFE
jgi:hypothetical protein